MEKEIKMKYEIEKNSSGIIEAVITTDYLKNKWEAHAGSNLSDEHLYLIHSDV
jgi:hypothetical protein